MLGIRQGITEIGKTKQLRELVNGLNKKVYKKLFKIKILIDLSIEDAFRAADKDFDGIINK